MTAWGVPCPDGEPIIMDGVVIPLAWRAHLVAAGPETEVHAARTVAEAQGYTLVCLPTEPGAAAPPELLEAFGMTV